MDNLTAILIAVTGLILHEIERIKISQYKIG